ncbi:uncharacterized protein LOC124416272 [Diprion similis]|uniref:uncharacterized protein LOC124416272 n=1 Tax=Diprion similis TaxID=362088 RepID=UPI001EF77705|nr:uncharacterized protein LOC124416272 [Diprion similis]
MEGILVGSHHIRQDSTANNIQQIKITLENLTKKFDTLDRNMNHNTAEVVNMRAVVTSCEQAANFCSDKVDELTRMVTELTRSNREMEATLQQGNLTNVVHNIAKTINANFKHGDIVDIFRAKAKPNKKQPIIVRMNNNENRNIWLEKRRTLIQTNHNIEGIPKTTKIYINEALTIANKSLLYHTKSFAHENNYKFVWVKDGKIFLRETEESRIIRIDSLTLLQKQRSINAVSSET